MKKAIVVVAVIAIIIAAFVVLSSDDDRAAPDFPTIDDPATNSERPVEQTNKIVAKEKDNQVDVSKPVER